MNHREYAARGNDLPHAKLNPELVREIRVNRKGETAKQLGARLGVHHMTIEKVRYFKSWVHVR